MGNQYRTRQINLVVAGAMASNITSSVLPIVNGDNIYVQLDWTGSPTGTFAAQVSNNYNQDAEGNVLNAGTWVPLVFSATPSTSSGSPIGLDMNQLGAPWLRIVYTAASGSGSLNVTATVKGLIG